MHRRRLLRATVLGGIVFSAPPALSAIARADAGILPAFGAGTLPAGIRSRMVPGIDGLTVHLLEAGQPANPLLVLLHGFPEIAYSWRRVMLPLAEAGFYVVAPDMRGYGRTMGWDDSPTADPGPFLMLSTVRECLGLVLALGHRTAAAVIGHDAGAPVAAWCALTRPDVFRSVVMMSAPFTGPPALPFDTATGNAAPPPGRQSATDEELATLTPPRKHYVRYFASPEANDDIMRCRQGLHDFLRAYFHAKSADWTGNRPHRLASASAQAMAELPTYYVMEKDKTMAETAASYMPTPAQIAACRWLPDDELAVFVSEYARTGFQGALHNYRRGFHPRQQAALQLYSGRTIDVPACFLAGSSDWGVYQTPGAVDRMRDQACTDLRGFHLVDGAGHWVQQEQPEKTVHLTLEFLRHL